MLTPLELLDRLAAPIPPPRRHRHRCFGVLAPNSLLRAAFAGPPLWEMPDAGQGQFDPQSPPAPDYGFDQRIAW